MYTQTACDYYYYTIYNIMSISIINIHNYIAYVLNKSIKAMLS